jgi:uncharacterized DUF497 family protein
MFERWLKEFEWDENRCKYNIAKHGLDFHYAQLVFSDKHRIESIDNRKNYGERRLQTIGSTGKHILFMAYTMRGKATRIISARLANEKERNRYYDNN